MEVQKKTLQQLRMEDGKSKRQYAKLFDIPYTTYARYEANLCNAPFDVVVRICKKLKIDITKISC